MTSIDLNADLGEGLDDADAALLEVVTSANVACGFHAGDQATARAVCAAAVSRGVAIGAHVGYRDRAGFGRIEFGASAAQVEAETAEQIGLLSEWAADAGGRVAYVKPHGALYHRATVDTACASAIARASGDLPVLAFPGSELIRQAATGVPEGFADRAYAQDGTLVPRDCPGAVLDADAAVAQAIRIARDRSVRSLCVHGDTPGAGALALRIRAALEGAGIALEAFA